MRGLPFLKSPPVVHKELENDGDFNGDCRGIEVIQPCNVGKKPEKAGADTRANTADNRELDQAKKVALQCGDAIR